MWESWLRTQRSRNGRQEDSRWKGSRRGTEEEFRQGSSTAFLVGGRSSAPLPFTSKPPLFHIHPRPWETGPLGPSPMVKEQCCPHTMACCSDTTAFRLKLPPSLHWIVSLPTIPLSRGSPSPSPISSTARPPSCEWCGKSEATVPGHLGIPLPLALPAKYTSWRNPGWKHPDLVNSFTPSSHKEGR